MAVYLVDVSFRGKVRVEAESEQAAEYAAGRLAERPVLIGTAKLFSPAVQVHAVLGPVENYTVQPLSVLTKTRSRNK